MINIDNKVALCLFRYHYLVLSFMQDEETELELDLTDEDLKVRICSPKIGRFCVNICMYVFYAYMVWHLVFALRFLPTTSTNNFEPFSQNPFHRLYSEYTKVCLPVLSICPTSVCLVRLNFLLNCDTQLHNLPRFEDFELIHGSS